MLDCATNRYLIPVSNDLVSRTNPDYEMKVTHEGCDFRGSEPTARKELSPCNKLKF